MVGYLIKNIGFGFCKRLLLVLLFSTVLFANNTTQNTAIELNEIEKKYSNSKNIWLISLQSYRNYMRSFQELEDMQNRLSMESTRNNFEEMARLKEEINVLKNNLNLYNYENRQPLYELFEPSETLLKQMENVTISFSSLITSELGNSVKQINSIMKDYYKEYEKAIETIDSLQNIVKNISISDNESKELKKDLISMFENDRRLLRISLDTLQKTHERVIKQYELYKKQIAYLKTAELRKLGYIFAVVVLLFILTNLAKIFFKIKKNRDKSEDEDQRHFMMGKILNILFAVITILIFAFTYVDNIAQILAVFGVVGAGLTVVMKEWVLSYVGWFVLITSNSIQMGDRIKISKDGRSIIGDVINISLTKLTLYENITNDALTEHKKAGRVIFVPNYYLIMGEVYNYTHLSLKTILDLIEIRMSFDSNIQKAEKIGIESAELITSRFTEMAKRQYDALKSRYRLRNMTQYPKIFFYPSAHGNGIVMGVWYVSPYREILKHKSEIMKEIIARINKEDDIRLLYSGQSVFLEDKSGAKT